MNPFACPSQQSVRESCGYDFMALKIHRYTQRDGYGSWDGYFNGLLPYDHEDKCEGRKPLKAKAGISQRLNQCGPCGTWSADTPATLNLACGCPVARLVCEPRHTRSCASSSHPSHTSTTRIFLLHISILFNLGDREFSFLRAKRNFSFSHTLSTPIQPFGI